MLTLWDQATCPYIRTLRLLSISIPSVCPALLVLTFALFSISASTVNWPAISTYYVSYLTAALLR